MSGAHSHASHPRGERRHGTLVFALVLTAIYMAAEAIGGWMTNSLALIADAGHMLTDVAALGLTLFAFSFASRPATSRKTYGYYRIEILAAFINGVALVLLSAWVTYEAVLRWRSPESVLALDMTLVAAGGLIVNIVVAKALHSGHQHDLNMRGAFLHVMGDLLGSVAAIAAGLMMLWFGWFWADAVCSILISVIIIFGAWRLVSESVNVLLEGTPRHIDFAAVEEMLLATEGVTGVHDLHVWTISSGIDALSAHINHSDNIAHSDLLATIRDRLSERFGIGHLTIQMESARNEAEALYVCETGSNCFETVRPS